MKTKTKADLIKEAKEKGLKVKENMSKTDIALLLVEYDFKKLEVVEELGKQDSTLIQNLNHLKEELEYKKLNVMEKVMAMNLLIHGYEFYVQYKIDCPEGWKLDGRTYFVVDFYIPDYELVIETDGKIHYTEENIIKDRNKDNTLISLGYRIFRFTWDDVMGSNEGFDIFAFFEELKLNNI